MINSQVMEKSQRSERLPSVSLVHDHNPIRAFMIEKLCFT